MGLMNGLSALGTSTAAFAGTAGLEQQKNDLAQQSMRLADQLATTRESAGRQEAGQIAMTAAQQQQGFAAGESALQRGSSMDIAKLGATTSIATANIGAGATLGAAGINAAASGYAADVQSKGLYAQIAALDPVRQQEVLASQQKTALETVVAKNASDLRDANAALAAEQTKPQPDADKVATAKAQILALGYSGQTEAAIRTAQQAIYRTDMDSVAHFNQQLVTATAALNNPDMQDTDRKAQKGLVANLQRQLDGATAALQYSEQLAHPGQGAAPAPPAGVPPGASYSPSLKMWRSTDGKLFDQAGRPTSAPGEPAPPAQGIINGGFGPGGPR